jgi:uncharacterized protein (DUF169 family)
MEGAHMLTEAARKAFSDLELPYPPIAIKFSRNRPEHVEQVEGVDVFCGFLNKAQTENRMFFTTIDNDKCMGKVVLGMTGLETNHGSGQVGREMGLFRTAAANARLYHEAPMLKPGVCNYVVFCPVGLCEFDPDLVVCIAPTEKAQLILRATSYISGDLWESRSSYVMSCAWTYIYPYVSGKVNHLITGMHFGLQLWGSYPSGLHIITVPYQKLDEVVTALNEMEHVPLGLRTDPEGKEKNEVVRGRLQALTEDIELPIRL